MQFPLASCKFRFNLVYRKTGASGGSVRQVRCGGEGGANKSRGDAVMKGLTAKQRDILVYIETFIGTEGMPPTVYEIADHFKIKTSTVFAHLRALQKKNCISRSSKARSIALTGAKRKIRPPAGLRAVPVHDERDDDPLLRTDSRKELCCDSSLFEKTLHTDCRNLYAFRVHGSGMKEFGILDGDIAIVKRHPESVKKGDILVTVENGEAALKSCAEVENDRLSLIDASGKTEECSLKEIPLKGVVVGVQRAL